MPWFHHLAVRTKLLLLLAALAAPFALQLALSTWRQAADQRMHAGDQMLGISRLTAARLDDHVGDVRQLLGAAAQVARPDSSSAQANDALLRKLTPQAAAQINGLSIWDLQGQNVGASNPGLRAKNPDVSKRRFFVEAMGGQPLAAEAPVRSIANDEEVIVLAVPILRDGVPVGVVAASTRIRGLQEVLQPDKYLPADAVITVTDENGVVVARSLDAASWQGRRFDLPVAMQSGRDGVYDGKSLDGIDRIGGYARARRMPWLVYVGIPTETVMRPFMRRVLERALIGLAMLIVGLVVATSISRTIAASLYRLREDASMFEHGKLDHRSTIVQGDEIGELGRTMNRMADALQQQTASLLASRTQLREITDNLPVAISYLNTEQRFCFANSIYENWIGKTPTELLGRTLEEVYGSATHRGFNHHIISALQGRRLVYEREMTTRSGLRHVEVTLIPHTAPSGEVQGLYVLIQDITEKREARTLIERSEQRLSLALDGAGAALFDWDIQAGEIYHSAQAAALRGKPAAEETVSAGVFFAWIHPDDRGSVQASIRATLTDQQEQHDVEFRVVNRQSGWVWIRGRGRVVERHPDGRPIRLAGTHADITKRKLAEQRLLRLATVDTLTGLPNRASFNERLLEAMVAPPSETLSALLFLDIDHFKRVNDTLGHDEGDNLLVDFARTLQDRVRSTDTVARLAGDEFTVILRGLRSVGDARVIAASLVAGARRKVGQGALQVAVSASIDMTFLDDRHDDPAAVLRRADKALYAAKRAGRDRFVVDVDVDNGESAAGELQKVLENCA